MGEGKHTRFTASSTAYLLNLDEEDRGATTYAIHYAPSPNSMIYPTLIMSNYLTDPKSVAEKIAAILEKHWDDEEQESSR